MEEEFDVPAYELWCDDATTLNAKTSAIKEDSIGNFVALQAWLAESQAIIETMKSIWTSFATGDLTLSAAGWLTNMAQQCVRHMEFPNNVDFSKALFCGHGHKKYGTVRRGVTLEELGAAEFSKIAIDSSFVVELTHGCSMHWPFALLEPFADTEQLPDFPEEKARRLEIYFRSASEERVAKESFAQSVIHWVACTPSELIPGLTEYPDRDHEEEIETICKDRYGHDRILLASLVKGASQHPLYEEYNPQCPPFDWDSKYIENALTVPLLCELKKKEGFSDTIVAAHMLLESGRSFVHKSEKIGKPPLNCRILVLRRANEVPDAIADLERGWTFLPVGEWLVELLASKLHTFRSNKTFDIYSQSPWVAGSQTSNISDLSLFVGLEILGERNCFGAVIHLYNMLQQILDECAEIPILEHLKTLFRSKVFPCNQEPRRGFGNTFGLFRGGAKTYKHPEIDMRIIARDGRRKPGREKEVYSKFSLTHMSLAAYESLFRDCAFSPEFMHRLAVDPKVRRRHAKLFDCYSPSELIQRAREVLRPEYDGTFPVARLNCFAVLRLCQDILLGIVARFKSLGTAAWPPEAKELLEAFGIKEVSVENAICYLTMTMRLVDGMWYGGHKNFSGKYHKKFKDAILGLTPVVIMREVIAEVCEGKNVEDFLWKNV